MAQPLPSRRNQQFPFDFFAQRGDRDDTAYYTLEPGQQFFRPWLRVPGGRAFVWPLGVEGFNLSIDPTLGIHKFVGDNAVEVDVVHLGEERIRLSGLFPGLSSVDAFQALRDLVYAKTPRRGKILYVPHLLTHAQRVVVGRAEFDHPENEIGTRDLSYNIEFVRIGIEGRMNEPPVEDPVPQPTPGQPAKGAGKRVFTVNAKYNTLRKIATYKFGNSNRWRDLFNTNEKWFRDHHIPAHKAPDYRLPNGLKIKY
jgi:hypothetical protein